MIVSFVSYITLSPTYSSLLDYNQCMFVRWQVLRGGQQQMLIILRNASCNV